MENEFEIRRAELKDAKGICDINHFWVEKGLKDEKSKGYLRKKNSYSIDQIEKLIKDSLVVVAAYGSKIVSFYFINPFFNLETIKEREKIIKEKIEAGILEQGKYALSLLGATDDNYLGQGFNSRTLKLLKELAAHEYDYFIGIMSYDNIATHKSSLKMGWKHYGDVGIGLLAVIGTRD